jgi:DNA invertase Pin-like site-specific DNA recombinase
MAYLAMRELADAQLFVDRGVSGSLHLSERPQGAALLAALETGEVETVVAVRLDRLFRDTGDTIITLRAWDAAGVTVHLVDMGGAAIDTRSAMGRLMLTVLAGIAEFERTLIAERTAAALEAKRSRGEYCGGDPPWGYTAVDGKLYQNAPELYIVALVEMDRERGETWTKIAAKLNKNGHLNRGRLWRHDTLIRRIGKFQPREAGPPC